MTATTTATETTMPSPQQLQLDLAVEDANLILEALGQLPFVRVFALIGKIQDQARRQLEGQPADRPAEAHE